MWAQLKRGVACSGGKCRGQRGRHLRHWRFDAARLLDGGRGGAGEAAIGEDGGRDQQQEEAARRHQHRRERDRLVGGVIDQHLVHRQPLVHDQPAVLQEAHAIDVGEAGGALRRMRRLDEAVGQLRRIGDGHPARGDPADG